MLSFFFRPNEDRFKIEEHCNVDRLIELASRITKAVFEMDVLGRDLEASRNPKFAQVWKAGRPTLNSDPTNKSDESE
jgi:hypothetical protein